jgi:hypothetical protein
MEGELMAASSNASDSNNVLPFDENNAADADSPLFSCASSVTLPRFPSILERKRYAKKMPRL